MPEGVGIGSLMIEDAGVEAMMGGVGGLAAAVCVAMMAAVAAMNGSPVMVGAGVGEGGGERVAAGVGKA